MIFLWKLCRQAAVNKFNYVSPKLLFIRQLTPKFIKKAHSDAAHLKRNITPRVEDKTRLADKVSDDCILIYRSRIVSHMTVFYHISYLLILTGIGGIYFTKYVQQISFPTSRELLGASYNSETEMIFIYIGMCGLNCILFIFCRIHAARIWYDRKKQLYTLFVVNGLTNSRMKKIEFTAGNVSKKYKNSIVSLTRAAHVINKRTYHIVDTNFRTPADYYKMLGNKFN